MGRAEVCCQPSLGGRSGRKLCVPALGGPAEPGNATLWQIGEWVAIGRLARVDFDKRATIRCVG